jgi:hypothetical protein
LILLTFVIGFALAVVFSMLGALLAENFDLWYELGKAGVQLGVIVVGGGALTTIVKALDAAREEKRRRIEEARGRVSAELSEAYSRIKDVRRALRAAGFRSPTGVLRADQVAELKSEMRSLSEIELSLEQRRREIRVQPDLFANGAVLDDAIGRIERYISGVVEEWEGARIVEGVDASEVGALLALQDFLAPASESKFGANASMPMRVLQRELVSTLASRAAPLRT